MKKHAYLIIAHNNFYILEKLLKLLDYEYNDIYIHIDKKVKDFDFGYYKSLTEKSCVYFTKKRFNVKWGHQTQVLTEMALYEMAYKGHYHYYHLISGVDMPIKTQKYIHECLDVRDDNFIGYNTPLNEENRERLEKYHIKIFGPAVEVAFLERQRVLRCNRLKNSDLEVKKGANWASLTDEAVGILVNDEERIKKLTRFSHCADEVYKQTFLYGKVKIHDPDGGTNPLHWADWSRSNGKHPHTFTMADWDMIVNSGAFFARKFDCGTDKEVVDKLYEHIRALEEETR